MNARKGLGRVERAGARRDAMRGERGLRGVRNRLLRERVRQSLESGVVLEREVNALVRFDEDEYARRDHSHGRIIGTATFRVVIPSGVPRGFAIPLVYRGVRRSSRDLLLVFVATGNSRSLTTIRKRRGWVRDDNVVGSFPVEREPVRIREARSVALPVRERRYVVSFAGHERGSTINFCVGKEKR